MFAQRHPKLAELRNEGLYTPPSEQGTILMPSWTGGANFTLAFEASYNGGGTFFQLDTSKTINSDGQYAYFYTGKPANRIRMRISAISSGTPNVIPIIAVAYHG